MNVNGLQITGMKVASPAITKKVNISAVQAKPKQIPSKVVAKKANVTTTQVSKIQPTQKKEVTKKMENLGQKQLKKQQAPPPKVQQKKIIEVPEVKKREQAPVLFDVVVRYNHYKEKFPCVNGVLNFAVPNQKYCFGLVFKGNYQPVLRHFSTRDIIEPLTTGKAEQFSWKVVEGQIYEVQIQQDEQEQAKYERHTYKAPEKPKQCPMKKNQRVEDLTNEMKNMGIDQLGGEKHREMLEQRDLEDILFS